MEGSAGNRALWVDWFPVQERLIDGFVGGEENVLFIDMAGGLGQDLKAFQAKFPAAPGRLILQDQAHVLEEADVGGEIERIPFDLFKPQPIQGMTPPQ